MDAEKMAREWLVAWSFNGFADSDVIRSNLAALLTTAHNTGLERAAEIADELFGPAQPNSMEAGSSILKAIRREIK